MGRKYLLGPEKEQVNIIIELKGEEQGYVVEKCWIATDNEFKDFEKRLSNWKNLLKEYYDVYVNS